MKKRIYELLQRGEDESLDYKQTITSASKIAKTMAAFANHHGGTLLVGVKDNRKVSGIKSDEEFYMLDLAARFFSDNRPDWNQPIPDVDRFNNFNDTNMYENERTYLQI